jgi:rRNA processing protein Krr1/Pno1
MSPTKAKIDTLKRTKDVATKNLKAERDRQKMAKAQQTIAAVTTSFPKS